MPSGGKILGQGQYGCVFIPPLKCKGTKRSLETNTQITEGAPIDKLITVEQAEYEFSIAQSIQQIPLWKNYFLVSESICDPAPIQVEKNIKNCDVLDEKELSNFKLLRLRYGGTPLHMYKIGPEFINHF